MNNNYPEKLELGINKKILALFFKKSETTKVLTIVFLPLFLVALYIFPMLSQWFIYELSIYKYLAVALSFLCSGVSSFLLLWVIGNLYERIWGNERSIIRASEYFVEVDGAFLRIADGVSDRKIHFRQIGDYEAILDSKDKSLPGVIRMRITGSSTQFLTIQAVEDVVATRDMLAQIDAERE